MARNLTVSIFAALAVSVAGVALAASVPANIAAALEQWVEKGTAPESIVAAKPGRARPLCAYPKTAKYKGAGSTDEAVNFECVQ